MKHKQTGTHLWNRALALLMAVFVTVQLTVPAYAETNTEPIEQDTTAVEMQLEESEKPAEPEALPVEETEAEAPAQDAESVEDTASVEDTETAQGAAPAEDAEPVQDEPAVAAENAKAFTPVDIPGYTRVNTADLEVGKYYLIVSQDSSGNLYAFYPDVEHKSADPGNAIVPSHQNHGPAGCPEGSFVAELTIDRDANSVSAQWLKDHSSLEMKDLHFVVEKSGNNSAFNSNGIYLSLTNGMLADSPTYFTTRVAGDDYTISIGVRQLDFNKAGDPVQFGQNKTNFWGPKDSRFPLYLYTKDGETAPVVVTSHLRTAIANAKNMLATLDAESRAALDAEIKVAEALLATGGINQDQVDTELAKLTAVMQSAKPNPDSIAPGAPDPGTTQGQPFRGGTAGSDYFRIPAMITLKHQQDEKLNGRVVTAIDARWNHDRDACSLDTIVSYTDDNGDNWHYNFANFFNDSTNEKHLNATAFIDPELVEAKDGTIYMMVDLFPGGVAINTAPRRPKEATGYQEVAGKQRLVLYNSIAGQEVGNWNYYVGDFQQDGYAPVIARDSKDGQASYYVDDHYYLYTAEKVKMYCQQIGSNKMVHQNVFFYNAALHVLDATYLWIVKSTDGGKTWHSPVIVNGQVRQQTGTSKFYGVGPGAGLCTQDGTIMLTAYTHSNEQCSFIYSTDQGVTWHRSDTVENGGNWSSESCLVEIDDHTVRQFYRDGHDTLYYTDHTKSEDGRWHAGHPVNTGVTKTQRNQLSAINYSGTLYGKPMIMVSTATDGGGRRNNGKVYTFVLENDKSMTLVNTHDVNHSGYGYSSITELENGSVALLYEGNGIQYTVIPKDQVVPAETYTEKDQTLDCGQSVTLPGNPKDAVVNKNPDVVEATNAMVEKKVPVYNGAQGNAGTNSSFTGELAPLSDALFRFIKTDSGYQITATTKGGNQVWMSTSTANTLHNPTGTAAESVGVEDAGNGAFYLHCKNGYLYLWRSGNNVATYDRFDRKDDACKFDLYRPAAKDEQVQSDIAGYVKVTDLNQIKDGDFYLITATVNGSTYVLNPSTDTNNKYSHNLKLNTNAPLVPEGSVSYFVPEFTMTAKTAGAADIQLGSTIYHVTVSHTFADGWKHDADPDHGHWHECTGCHAKVEEAHTYKDEVIQEPTCTTGGRVRHTCTVCGFSYETVTSMTPHTLEHVPEVPATIEHDGILEHWKCTVCGNSFVDEEGKFYIDDELLRVSRVVTGDTVVAEPAVKPEATQAQKDAIQSAHSALKTPNAVVVKGSSYEKQISISADGDQNFFLVSGVVDKTTGENGVKVTGETLQQVMDDNHLNGAKDYLFVAEAFLKAQVVDANTSGVTYHVAPYANLKIQSELGDALVDTVPVAAANEAITITLTLPDNFAVSADAKIQVEYVKQDGTKGYYDVVREGNQITFEAVNGFGDFTVMTVSNKPVNPEQPVTPDKPVDPNKPVEPTKPTDKDPGHVTPPTGDSTPVFLWSAIAVVCIACIVTMIVYRKKKNHN